MKIAIKGSHRDIRKFYSTNSLGPNFSWKEITPEDQISLSQLVTSYPVRLCWKDFLEFFSKPDFIFRTLYYNIKPIGYICYRRWSIYFKSSDKCVDVPLVEFYFGSSDRLRYAIHKINSEGYPFIYSINLDPLLRLC